MVISELFQKELRQAYYANKRPSDPVIESDHLTLDDILNQLDKGAESVSAALSFIGSCNTRNHR